jgi:hypothetical protein
MKFKIDDRVSVDLKSGKVKGIVMTSPAYGSDGLAHILVWLDTGKAIWASPLYCKRLVKKKAQSKLLYVVVPDDADHHVNAFYDKKWAIDLLKRFKISGEVQVFRRINSTLRVK